MRVGGVKSPFSLSPRPSSSPLFSHPCRPEEGVFYGKHGPPGFDRGSKLITGLPELSQQAERCGETFREGGGDSSGVLGSSEEILAVVSFPKKCLPDPWQKWHRQQRKC